MSRREIAQAFDQIVAFAEIDAFVDTPVKRYSSMYVRLAFAVAAHLRSDILLVDEVLAVGDVAFRRKCLGQMSAVSRQGRTIIFVSHNMGAVRTLCQSCLLLEHGRLLLHDKTETALNEYLRRIDQGNDAPLAERRDRDGNGAARITSITILDEHHRPSAEMYAGRRYTFSLTYECQRVIPQATVAIGFLSPMGGPLFQLNNTFVDRPLALNPPEGCLHCQIPRLPLNSGLYQVNVLIKGAGEIYDHVQAALYVNVVQDDFYGSGVMPPPSVGAFLIDHSWMPATSAKPS
jgi:lipopolysaccharide transport system ATP-binding protein